MKAMRLWCVLTAFVSALGLPAELAAQRRERHRRRRAGHVGRGAARRDGRRREPGAHREGPAVVTDEQGQYRIVDLRPGIYTVTFTLPASTTCRREGIELTGRLHGHGQRRAARRRARGDDHGHRRQRRSSTSRTCSRSSVITAGRHSTRSRPARRWQLLAALTPGLVGAPMGRTSAASGERRRASRSTAAAPARGWLHRRHERATRRRRLGHGVHLQPGRPQEVSVDSTAAPPNRTPAACR